MSKKVIQVEGLYKQYRLGQVSTGTISHDLNRWWHKIRGKEDPYEKITSLNNRIEKGSSDYVWAIEDINFDVNQGDVVGIIGRNGAGKSTLLKLLSKVTTPTKGSIKLNGRIASLLEVGTGFHPELTGKENIYLNGAILGMTKTEIRSKFDEIVAFSGVEKYVDTPVKRYSSGMYVRLAFAVAAHLEPEILIVDEVLAVGDAEFQKKCLGKMKDVSSQGRTILFVSHNMAAVKGLCNRGILLSNGRVVKISSVEDTVNTYQKLSNQGKKSINYKTLEDAPGNELIKILEFEITPLSGNYFSISSGICFRMKFYNHLPKINLAASLILKNFDEVTLCEIGSIITENSDSEKGIYTISGIIPPNILNAGNYYFNVLFGQNQRIELYFHEQITSFEILNEKLGSNYNPLPGVLSLKPEIKVDYTNTI